METTLSRAEQIARIASLPDELADAVDGLDDARLDTPYREGGWTVRQVVHHLADSHVNAYARMRWILTEDGPAIKTYDQDDWAGLPDARRAPIASSLSLLRGLHARWAWLLEELPETAWSREGRHPESGIITLASLLQLYAGHGRHHVEQIRGLREREGW